MNVNNSISISPLNKLSTPTPAQKNDQALQGIPGNKQPGVNISSLGMASSAMSGLSPAEQAEATDFTKSVQQAKQSGSFDAAKLAEQAPESVNELAKQLNISTEEMLTNSANKGPQGLMSTGSAKNENTAIGAYLDASVGNTQTDSFFDFLNIFSSDDKGKKS